MLPLTWFQSKEGSYVQRNGRAFFIANERVAEYAWELQASGFKYEE